MSTFPDAPETARGDAEGFRALAATAFLGTDHAAGGGTESPVALLRSAAVAAARRRAGRKALAWAEPFGTCPVDSVSVVTPACAARLEAALERAEVSLVTEWLGLAVTHGGRVPERLAADVMGWAATHPVDADVLRAALGARFEWLRTCNPVWRARWLPETVLETAEDTWRSESVQNRMALLRRLRRVEPARAEGLVRTTWDEDPAEQRQKFVACFEVGLSPADEPFLEHVLGDRARGVRSEAAALLALVPGSAFTQRMVERVAGVVRVVKIPGGIFRPAKVTVTVDAPTAWDDAWERDGLTEKAPPGRGPRAWWLQQLLGAASLRRVLERLGIPLASLFAACAASEYADAAVVGLFGSAGHSPDPALNLELARLAASASRFQNETSAPLWSRLTGPEREALLSLHLRSREVDARTRLQLVLASDHAWSPAFSEAACAQLRSIDLDGGTAWSLPDLAVRSAAHLHPSAIRSFQAALEYLFPDGPPPAVLRAFDHLHFRAEMRQEFHP